MKNACWNGMVCGSLLLATMTCAAQRGSLHGAVREAGTDRPLAGAHVAVEGGGGVTTDGSGHFTLAWNGEQHVVVRVTHIGFIPAEIELGTGREQVGDTLVIRLVRQVVAIPEVVVRRGVPEVVYQSEELHVGDLLVDHTGLWVMMYRAPRLWHRAERAGERIHHGAWLFRFDHGIELQARTPMPGPVRALHRDHAGRPVVEGEDLAWMADDDGGGIVLHALDRETLERGVLPWTDSLAGRLLGSDRTDTWPVVEHVAFDLASGSQGVFCSVEDHFVMELFRSQYKYMSGRDKVIAMDLEIETGIDREIIAGYMTGFPDNPYFSVPYAPLFVVDDTLFVFDHVARLIHRFTSALVELPRVNMQHPSSLQWRSLIQDRANGRIYACYAKASRTWLRELDPRSGALGAAMPIAHPFPEQLQVYDGQVYYIHREHGSTQHRTLYRETLGAMNAEEEWISPVPDGALARRSKPASRDHAMRSSTHRSEGRAGPGHR